MLPSLNRHINRSVNVYIKNFVGGNRDQSIEPVNEVFCDNDKAFTAIKKVSIQMIRSNDADEMKTSNIHKQLLGEVIANNHFALTM